MNERFIRCAHCGMPHEESQAVCPNTGKPIERRGPRALAPTRNLPVSAPAHPRPPRELPPLIEARGSRPSMSDATHTSPGGTRRDLIGRTIGGKYNVRAVLGEGGMGTVFEALNLSVGRQVAIKVLHPNQLRKKDSVRRFHQEARAAGAIGHPNICEVYDLGTLDDGCPYLVMEKLVGETLADRIANEGGLPIDEVLDTLTQVLSGLVAAHEKGIVHRDIKPENVFLTRRVGCAPVAKLLDFGVSKIVSVAPQGDREEGDMTRTGIVLGTPYYLAPEQARGDRNLDARVDLYACGVMLYEALTGRRPFSAQNYNALLISILTGSPKPARDVRPALPRAFDKVIEKAMAREPSDRYQSAVEFQEDLQKLSARTSGAASPMRQSARLPPPLPLHARMPKSVPPHPESSEPILRTTRRNASKRANTTSSVDIPIDFTVPPPFPPEEEPRSRPWPPLPPPRLPAMRAPAPSARSAPPRPPPRRKIEQGFDDMPTEVEQPEAMLGFRPEPGELEEAKALLQGEDVRRFVAGAKRPGLRPSAPFVADDSKTDVMSQEVKDALRRESERPPRPRR